MKYVSSMITIQSTQPGKPRRQIKGLVRLSQSPDLNPIVDLMEGVDKRQPLHITALEICAEKWAKNTNLSLCAGCPILISHPLLQIHRFKVIKFDLVECWPHIYKPCLYV